MLDDNRCVAEWLSSELNDGKSQLNQNLSYIAQDYLNSKMQKMFKENTINTTESIVQLIHNTLTVEEKSTLIKKLSSSLEENSKISMEQLTTDNLEDDNGSSDDSKDKDSQNSEN